MSEYICYFNNVRHVFTKHHEWYKAESVNIYHRDSDNPSYIYKCNRKIEFMYWIKNGKIHLPEAGYRL
jgi:hypothetical protein